jgi:hypothetical protein
MAGLSSSTFSAAGGAVSDLFAGLGAKDKANLQAQGMRITAEGTLITAQGTRLNADALRTKAGGDLAEADTYDLASTLAEANKSYTEQSTRIQLSQADRAITQAAGSTRAGAAGAGFGAGGSAGDILRDSASQGALQKGVLAQQGVITEAGYEEQSASYKTLSGAARATAASEFDAANKTDTIATEQEGIASQQQILAQQTQEAGDRAATGDFIGAALKGAAAIASIGLAPFTGGASLAVGAAVTGGLDGLEAIH